MNKWRLLLLSVLSLLQSASTEQNFVDGRNRYRWSDTRFSGHESYRLLGQRQLDIPNKQSNLVRNVDLTTPALRRFRRTELRWWLPFVQDKYDGTDCVTRFRIRAQNDRHLNRQSTLNLNKASDVGRHKIVRDFTDYRKNIGSISSFRNNNDKKDDTRFRLNSADERQNYDDMLSRNKRNSRDTIINNIRTKMYDEHTNFLNRDGYMHDGTKRAFRKRVFSERASKGISLYEEPEGRRQTTKTFDSIYNCNNVYRSSSEDVTRRTVMNQNNKEKDISRYNFVKKSRSHNYMRNKACNKLVGKATLSDESCIANTRESKLETIKDAGDNTRRNNARRIVISEFSIRDGSRVFCPEELNSKILNTRTANIILRKNIERHIPNFRSRNLSAQIRTQNTDVYNRNIQERSSTLRHNSFGRDIYSTNVFSTGVSFYIINTNKNNFQDNKRNSNQEITLTRQKAFSPEDTQRDTLRRSQRHSIRKIQSNKLQNIRKIRNLNIENRQRNNKNENQMENIGNVRRERINNIHLNDREKHSVQKRFVIATLSNRNSYNDRSRSLSTQKTRRNTNKFGCTSNERDEKILNNLRLTHVSRLKQRFSNLYDNERTTETSKLTRRERSRSVSFGEIVANRIKNNRNTQQNLVNVQSVTIIREKQNLRPKLHVTKKMQGSIEHINRERSTLLSTGNLERARSVLHIDPVSRKLSISTRKDNTNENRNLQDKRFQTSLTEEKIRNIFHSNRNTPARPLQRSQSRLSSERQYLISKLPVRNTKYIEDVHQERSRSLAIEKRVRTEDIREERSLRKRSITPLNRETQQVRDMERNRGRSAINGRPSRNQNILKYQNVQLFTFLRSEKQNSISKRYQIPSRSDRTQSDRITNRIHINRYIENTRIPNERRKIISSRQNSNPTIVFIVNRKNTNEFRLNEFRSLSTEKRITNQIMNIRHVREERLQDMRYRSPVNREKPGMLSRQREGITNQLEKTRTNYNERRQNTQVSSSEREHFTTKLYGRQLEHSDNNRQDKLRTSFTRERTTNEIQHSGYSRKDSLQNNENIPKLYANERSIVKTDRYYNSRIISDEDKLERDITRHIKVKRFMTRQHITPLNRDSVPDKDLQINKRHMTNVGDIRNLYRSTIHRTNEYNIRDSITDTRRTSLTMKRQCTSLQCSMSTSVISNTQKENVFEFKWQLLFYLLQGIYLWNLLIKKPKTNGELYKNRRFTNWFTAMDYMKIH